MRLGLRFVATAMVALSLGSGCVLVADFDEFREANGDAGQPSTDAAVDAGRADGGTGPGDAGLDAGVDAGVDAGEHPGVDAGEGDSGPPPDACTASPELCNGIDDDCDGTVDDTPTDCEAGANESAVCSAGTCTRTCTTGFDDCTAAPGCETSLSSHDTCGGCSGACGVSELCLAMTCTPLSATRAWFVEQEAGGSARSASVATDARGYTYLALTVRRQVGAPAVSIVGSDGTIRTYDWPIGTTGPHSIIVAFDETGSYAWDVRMQTDASGGVDVVDLEAGSAVGDTFAIATFAAPLTITDSAGTVATVSGSDGNDGILLAIRPDGTLRWRTVIGGSGSQTPQALTVLPGAIPIVAGTLQGELRTAGVLRHTASYASFVAAYDSTGFPTHHAFFDGYAYIDSLVSDTTGNVYVGARLEGLVTIGTETYDNDRFLPLLVAYDSTLTLRWSDLIDGTDGWGEETRVSLAAHTGALYSHFALSGELNEGSVTVPAGVMLLRHEVDGSGVRWGRPLDDTPAASGDLAVDGAGNVLVHTKMNPSLPGPDFGGGTLTSHGSTDFVLASYEPDSSYRYARNMGGIEADQADEIATHTDGRILLLGEHRGSVTIDGIPHTASSANGDVFLLEVAP